MVEGGDFSVNTEEVLTIGTINLEMFRHIFLHNTTLAYNFLLTLLKAPNNLKGICSTYCPAPHYLLFGKVVLLISN